MALKMLWIHLVKFLVGNKYCLFAGIHFKKKKSFAFKTLPKSMKIQKKNPDTNTLHTYTYNAYGAIFSISLYECLFEQIYIAQKKSRSWNYSLSQFGILTYIEIVEDIEEKNAHIANLLSSI